jgi:hypothetical protein
MKLLSRIISALVRMVACLLHRVLALALYVPYTVICTIPKFFENLVDWDRWETFEALMHNLVSYNFREYDRTLYREIESEQWCDGFESCRRQYEARARQEASREQDPKH